MDPFTIKKKRMEKEEEEEEEEEREQEEKKKLKPLPAYHVRSAPVHTPGVHLQAVVCGNTRAAGSLSVASGLSHMAPSLATPFPLSVPQFPHLQPEEPNDSISCKLQVLAYS